MNSGQSPAAATATLRRRRERLMVQPFRADYRASLPRPLRRPTPPNASLAGVPPELRDRVGRHLHPTAFPYPQFIHSDGAWGWAEFELVELENARWQVVICPDLGGRILRIFDRRAQRDVLLQPPAVCQAVIGLPGAWFVGGVEFNAFRYGHNIHGQSRIATHEVRLRDGTVAVEFGACDELFGCEWRVAVALGASQVFLRVTQRNHSREPQPDYWWTTIAVPAHRHTRIMAAPGPVLHHGMFRVGYQHERWPRLHGRDWSRWPEHHEIVSAYLYEHDSNYFGSVDETDGFSFVHLADRNVCRGRKVWSISAGRDNAAWSDRLLEPAATSYLELQSGRHPLQVEGGLIEPGEVRSWTESVGAIVFPGAADDGDYGAAFAHFAELAHVAMGAEYANRNTPAAWEAQTATTIVAASPRVELSARILREPENISAAEIARVVEHGWVAGDAWTRKLETLLSRGEITVPGRLVLAAAWLDRGEREHAIALLQTLAAGEDETAGWAAYLLGLESGAIDKLEYAAARLSARPEGWLALDGALARAKRHGDRQTLWQRVPPELLTRDDVRVARAAGAHARGAWKDARALLEAPLPTNPEGSPQPWLIFRESFVAEALANWRAGRLDQASELLFRAGQPAPQFGVGRDEAGWGSDLIYYRWRVARAAGRQLEADLLVSQGLSARPYAGSIAAAYAARLAHEAAQPGAAERIQSLNAWNREAGEAGRAGERLRSAVIGSLTGNTAAWASLRDDPLYGFRAAFELECR